MRNSKIYNPALGALRLSSEATAFLAGPQPAAPARSSALECVPATASLKYPRRQFYLKIEGLEGRRNPVQSARR